MLYNIFIAVFFTTITLLAIVSANTRRKLIKLTSRKDIFMTSENGIYENFSLQDISNKLRSARDASRKNVPAELYNLCDYIADIIDTKKITMVTPKKLVWILSQSLADLAKDCCCHTKNVKLSEILKYQRTAIVSYISYFPLIIDAIADKNFAKTFREDFSSVFGESQPPVNEIKENYGVKIIRKNMVDISNKDKAEVVVSLYNNSHPQGIGFLHSTNKPITIEMAREFLDESTHFNYLAGRVMKVDLSTNIVYTGHYNRFNGDGAAERAISQCHNIN